MSVESAKGFIEKARNDDSIQAKVEAIQATSKEEAIAGLIDIAGEHGHSFEREHYAEAVRDHIREKHAADALTDEELDAVSGGCMTDESINPPPGTKGYSMDESCKCITYCP